MTDESWYICYIGIQFEERLGIRRKDDPDDNFDSGYDYSKEDSVFGSFGYGNGYKNKNNGLGFGRKNDGFGFENRNDGFGYGQSRNDRYGSRKSDTLSSFFG